MDFDLNGTAKIKFSSSLLHTSQAQTICDSTSCNHDSLKTTALPHFTARLHYSSTTRPPHFKGSRKCGREMWPYFPVQQSVQLMDPLWPSLSQDPLCTANENNTAANTGRDYTFEFKVLGFSSAEQVVRDFKPKVLGKNKVKCCPVQVARWWELTQAWTDLVKSKVDMFWKPNRLTCVQPQQCLGDSPCLQHCLVKLVCFYFGGHMWDGNCYYDSGSLNGFGQISKDNGLPWGNYPARLNHKSNISAVSGLLDD